ncbi:MAG: hypothetical protein JSR17_00695 [Proteobacteria bacterium]|nr:hypothetical protein [Pseudomonadota bacterium]
MILGPLCVLHLKELNHQGSEDNPLSAFKKQFIPFSPMSCARHVYIFLKPQAFSFEPLLTYLRHHTEAVEFMADEKAYAFLLRWATGCESWKLKGNDHFVLGTIRKHWGDFVKENPTPAKTIEPLMAMLFEDASGIRRQIQEYEDGAISTNEALKSMCNNCASSRAHGLKPNYENLLQDNLAYFEAARMQYFDSRLKAATKSIKALNAKASDPILVPTQAKDMGVFKANITFCFEKMQITKAKESAAEPKRLLPQQSSY